MTETEGRVRRALDGDSSGLHSRILPLDDIEILSRAKGGDGRTVVAYAATFGHRAEINDQDGHYTEENHPHAFNKTVADKGLRFGVFYHHARTLHGTPSEEGSVPLGRPVLVQPDSRGLLTHTAYNRTPLADRVLESIRNGDPMGMSYTGAYLRSDPPKPPYYSRSDGSLQHVVRKEIALIEYGPTPTPAFTDAEILGVRAAQAREAARAAADGTGTDAARPAGALPYARRDGENVQCPDCGAYNEADANYCDQCGAQLPESAFRDGRQPYQREGQETVQCPACGRYNEPDAVYCDQCGAALPESAYEGDPAVPGGTDAMSGVTATGSTSGRAMSTARHEPVNGTHSHAHPAYGAQGGDATHTHEHSHAGDANHAHSHAAPGDSGEGDGGMTGRSGPLAVIGAHFGWTPEQVSALSDAERSLLLAGITGTHAHHERAVVDDSTWDGNAAMSACTSAADYRAICAGEHSAGTPGERQHWALPHHKTPGAPPNAAGVRNSLSRLPQTQDLVNRQAAQAHLDAHMKAISPDAGTSSGDGGTSDEGTSGRSQTTPAAAGTGAAEPAPEAAAGTVEPHEHSTAQPDTSERTTTVEPTIEQRTARRGEIDSRILAISTEYGERALPAAVQAEWDALSAEQDEHTRAIEEHERAVEARRERVRAIAARQAGNGGGTPGERVDAAASGYTAPAGTGERGTPALLPGRTDDSIWDMDDLRSRSRSAEELTALCRDNAFRAIERAAFPGSESRERAQSTVERLLTSVDDEDGTLAKRILVTGNPLYRRAWGKAVARLTVNVLDGAESRALALGVGADGGFAVPFELDPSILLTSNGAISPIRQLSRNVQITGKEYDLVTSQGVTVSRSAEAATVDDNTPTLAQPTIKAERVTGFIRFSIEIQQDWNVLQSEMMTLLADAKDVEECKAYTIGTGVAPDASGIISTLDSSSHVAGTGGAGVLAAGDLDALENAAAPRFRARAVWMASKTAYNAYRALLAQQASSAGDDWARPSAGQPPMLRGYPAHENSEMTTTHATGDKVILFGDFGRGAIVVDRLGMSTELVPHLVDGTTGRPTGERGLLMIWRNNFMPVIANCFRLLVVS